MMDNLKKEIILSIIAELKEDEYSYEEYLTWKKIINSCKFKKVKKIIDIGGHLGISLIALAEADLFETAILVEPNFDAIKKSSIFNNKKINKKNLLKIGISLLQEDGNSEEILGLSQSSDIIIKTFVNHVSWEPLLKLDLSGKILISSCTDYDKILSKKKKASRSYKHIYRTPNFNSYLVVFNDKA